MTDMKHLDYLEYVAKEDVRELQRKEKTYRGSWKRRGGVGAFMMLARKWDRLESMALSCPKQYDVFAMMTDEQPITQGADGTALAEIRDLRRYLLLVEAEMMARSDDVSAQKELGLQIDTPPLPNPGNGSHHATLTPWLVSKQWLTQRSLFTDMTRAQQFDKWFRQAKVGVWAPEPFVVTPSDPPVEIGGIYENVGVRTEGLVWAVKIKDCPADAREHYPRLQLEVNRFELDQIEAPRRALYGWIEDEGKFRLKSTMTEWHVEQA